MFGLPVQRDSTRRVHRLMGQRQQLADRGIAIGIVGGAALLDLGQPVRQRVDQCTAPLGVVEQVVLEIRVALHRPDVAQHLVQHASRAAGAALTAQPRQHLPGALAEQAYHDLAIGVRGVVVWNLAQARRRLGTVCTVLRSSQRRQRLRCVHGALGSLIWRSDPGDARHGPSSGDVTAAQQRHPVLEAAARSRRVIPLAAGSPSMTETPLSWSRPKMAGFVCLVRRTECS
jgi:hypothetical protein